MWGESAVRLVRLVGLGAAGARRPQTALQQSHRAPGWQQQAWRTLCHPSRQCPVLMQLSARAAWCVNHMWLQLTVARQQSVTHQEAAGVVRWLVQPPHRTAPPGGKAAPGPYTHLTLPTKRDVENSVGRRCIKKKTEVKQRSITTP